MTQKDKDYRVSLIFDKLFYWFPCTLCNLVVLFINSQLFHMWIRNVVDRYQMVGGGVTRVRQVWWDWPANVEVTLHGQYLMKITISLYPCTKPALIAVKHIQRYYWNLLVVSSYKKQSATVTAWTNPWCAVNWYALIVLDLVEDWWTVQHLLTWLPNDLTRAQWHFIDSTYTKSIITFYMDKSHFRNNGY